MKTCFLALSLLVSGLAFAQQPQFSQRQRPQMRQRPTEDQMSQRFEQRLAQHLGLSAEQVNKVHTTLADSRVQSNGLHERMGALNTSLQTAIKAGDEGQIDKLSQDIANLHQQQAAIHAKTIARVYSTLTPDQKTKIGDHLEMLSGRGPGFGPGGPRGRGPAAQGGLANGDAPRRRGPAQQ
jgi:Spy/CpxP family protein refolding chaperone